MGNPKELFRSLKPKHGSMSAYLFALGCVIVATLIRLSLDSVVPEDHSMLTIYVPAVLLAGVVGGVRAGALALVASTLISWWLFLPLRHSFVIVSVLDAARLTVFVVVGGFILWGAHRYRQIIESLSAEVALRKMTTERLRLATHVSGLGIFDYDAVADVLVWSPELYAIVGLASEVTVTRSTGPDLVHPEDKERIHTKHLQALAPCGTGEFDEEYRIRRADNGETRWIHELSQTHFSGERAEHRAVRATGVVVDVTARKIAEEQAELQREKLTHLMRVAMLGGLSGGIAHELGQPLASILANAQAAEAILARKDPDLKEVAEILKDIAQEDHRAGEVIRRLRKLLSKQERQLEPISLNELILSTLRLVRSELLNRSIRIETELKANLPSTWGDSVELQQVFLNLIMNGVEAMTSTPPSNRTLSIATQDTKEGYVEVSIRDRGTGMSPDELKRIDVPFFTTKEGGLGLGLSICSVIVRSHAGRLTLSNVAGGGIVATISLPTTSQLATVS